MSDPTRTAPGAPPRVGVADPEDVLRREADIAVQQISELLPVKGVVLVGPLPREIQNYTVYSTALAADPVHRATAQALIDLLQSGPGRDAVTAKGMEPIDRATPAK